jgi:hypothetical protein
MLVQNLSRDIFLLVLLYLWGLHDSCESKLGSSNGRDYLQNAMRLLSRLLARSTLVLHALTS